VRQRVCDTELQNYNENVKEKEQIFLTDEENWKFLISSGQLEACRREANTHTHG